jgi:YggT family protein
VDILCALITVFLVVLFARAVLSWFPIRPGTFLAQVSLLLRDLTEWALAPLRRVIPPAGMFDLSFIVLFFFLIILRGAICS